MKMLQEGKLFGLPLFVKAGAIIPMMPEMDYIYEKIPEPITLDIYPVKNGTSKTIVYDCDSVKPPLEIKETFITTTETNGVLKITIDGPAVAYELCIHNQNNSSSVIADGKKLRRLKTKAKYDKAEKGFYFGSSVFYGSDKILTTNIKIPEKIRQHNITIMK